MSKCLLSVLMPVYNTPESYLRPAIESILSQTYSDFEFIIIDDGSTNNAAAVIKSYRDKRIRYVKNEQNLGLIKTLNKGLDMIKTPFIARMDSDDISLPDRFEKQMAYMAAHPDVGILGAGVEFFPEFKIWQPKKCPKIFDFLDGCPLAHPTVLFRTDVLTRYGLRYDPAYPHAEDYALWTSAVFVTKIENIGEVLLKYRWHDQNISHTKKDEQHQSVLNVRRDLRARLTDDAGILDSLAQTGTQTRKINRAGITWFKIKYKPKKINVYLFGLIKIFTIKRI